MIYQWENLDSRVCTKTIQLAIGNQGQNLRFLNANLIQSLSDKIVHNFPFTLSAIDIVL